MLGMLLLTGKLKTDPNGKGIHERFVAAQKGGFVIPEDVITSEVS